jgi:MFS transporter, AAHS family, 4-hydroxybenzoate transporter
MVATETIDISQIIDGQRRSGFLVQFIALISLMALFDGYDFSAMAFAAPSLIREWHIDKGAFGAVFAAATLGGILGSFVFGYVSDRWGRKRSAMTAVFLFGLFSLVTVYAANLQRLLALRFLAGTGIGATVPIVFTIVVEFAPQRRDAVTMAAVISIGLGIMAAGFIAASLIPIFGWKIIFWIAGLGPLAISALVFFVLPESPRFLLSISPRCCFEDGSR